MVKYLLITLLLISSYCKAQNAFDTISFTSSANCKITTFKFINKDSSGVSIDYIHYPGGPSYSIYSAFTPPGTHYVDYNDLPDGQYYMIYKFDFGQEIDIVGGKECIPTAISNIDNETAMTRVYPNPFSLQTNIYYKLPINSKQAFLKIYSLEGVIIKSVPLSIQEDQILIDSSHMPPGMYITSIEINGVENPTKQRLIVVK